MSITVTPFATLPSTPKLNPIYWAPGQDRGFRDVVTGDLCQWRDDGSAAPVQLYTSQNNGQTWALTATNATTPYTGGLTGVLSVCQDVTNGAAHFLMYNRTSTTSARGYGRATLVRSGGHVTGYTWTQTPFALTTHTSSSLDPRGTISIFKIGGTEFIVYLIGLGNSSTVATYYAGLSTSLTPSSSAGFTGINGTGSDTQVINLTVDSTFGGNHQLAALIAQDDITEDLYLFFGFVFSGDLLNNTGTSSSAVWYKRLAKSGSSWTAPTANTAGTTIVSEDASTIPALMSVRTGPGLGRAYVMVGTPTSGVKLYYLSSGSLTTVSGSPISTAHRGGFGTFSVDGSGNIYVIACTMGVNDATPAAYESSFNGTTWTTTTDTGADTVGVSGCAWSLGVAAIQDRGSSMAQTQTAAYAASIFSSGSSDITVSVSGQAATSTIGTVSPSRFISLNGQPYSVSSGSIIPAVSIQVIGQPSSWSAQSFIVSLNGALSGQGVTWAAGAISAGSDLTVSLVGQSGTSVSGNISPGVSVTTSGQLSSVSSGVITLSLNTPVLSQIANISSNSISPSISASLFGRAIVSASGSVSVNALVFLAGQSSSYSIGIITVSAGGNVTVSLTGQPITLSMGSLSSSCASTLNGATVTSALNSIISIFGVQISGQSLGLSNGQVVSSSDMSLASSPVGVSSGLLSAQRVIFLSGNVAVSGSGTISVSFNGDVTVGLTGTSLATLIGSISTAYTLLQQGVGTVASAGIVMVGAPAGPLPVLPYRSPQGLNISNAPWSALVTGPLLRSGPDGLTIGNFAWVNSELQLASNKFSVGQIIGFVPIIQTSYPALYVASGGSLRLRSGYPVQLIDSGTFWARFVNGATIGQRVYAYTADGSPISGFADNAIPTKWKVATNALPGELAAITTYL